jgi:ADP-ribosylglycohydrolase
MKKIYLLICLMTVLFSQAQTDFTISRETLKNKIKGGWAGQTIGVTFGAPVEFRYNGTMINAYHKIPWYDGLIKKSMTDAPGIYDDLYMDLTFVEVMEREGLDAPVSSHAKAFAHAGYDLWHANQAARYNILNGIDAPGSGFWKNNPHADCIDYQIESDFAGLMSPGMPNTASAISDKIGHIMNYGDGWYGGVFMGALYTLAFTSNDISQIVNESLKTIPVQSKFHQCISDVIRWQQQYPQDWQQTWFEIQKKWTEDVGCPDGIFAPFNIDATVNAAYVVLGLLYGNGDFTKTMEITTRCGQDADCNPSSAGGILGTLLGYDKIPDYWKQGLKEAEDLDFKYTHTSLNDVYEIGMKHALENIRRNGGKTDGEKIVIQTQKPQAVRFEESFSRHHPIEKKWLGMPLNNTVELAFEGNGFVIKGDNKKQGKDASGSLVADVEVYIDGLLFEKVALPVSFTTRRYEIAWKYDLKPGKHTVQLKILNPNPGMQVYLTEMIIYSLPRL